MGSKGSQTTNTSQQQTYAPAGYSYIQNALQQGQNAAQLQFNIPQAPVAGFSQDQLSAFQNVNNAQGSAQPYYNQAQSLYGQAAQQPNVAAFYNPMASAVTSQMQNIFGEQNAQNTGSLTQAAGGVGADRIAVGQADLANQQGLAAGQTYAGLYGQAQKAAQAQQQAQLGAGNALQGLGTNVLNSQLTGANALLGTGGLQQQLQQAQLNSPYQQQLAQAAFPYQQAQFNAGITGALAPALGGTTQGQGQTTSQYNPSIFSQILGGAGALGSLGGYLGGTGSKGTNSYGGGSPFTGDAYGGSAAAPLPGLTSLDYGARGGSFGSYAGGGSIPVYSVATGFDNKPINVSQLGIIPQGQLSAAQAHMPNLNLNPPSGQSQQQNSGASLTSALGGIGKIASLFAARGGAVNPYALLGGYDDGGSIGAGEPSDDQRAAGLALLKSQLNPDNVINPGNPFRMADPEAVQAWRDDASNTAALPASAGDDASDETAAPSGASDASVPPNATPTSGTMAANPYAATSADDSGPSLGGFLKSPYAALLQASLGAFTPKGFAGGLQEGLQNFQKQETTDQAARKLQQEAQEHLDEYTKLTAAQQATNALKQQELDKGTDGVITDETAKFLAKQYLETGVIPQVGYGKAASQSRAKIFEAAQQLGGDPGQAKLGYGAQGKAYRDFSTGAQGNTIRSFDVATAHLNQLDGLVTALGNGDPQAINRAGNAWAAATGQPAPTNFNAARSIVADEIVKAIIGSRGALGDREAATNSINSAMSPAQLHGVIRTYQGLMTGQLLGLKKQYEDTTGKSDFAERLSPATRDSLLNHVNPQSAGFTGKTAINRQTGARLRQTTDGKWVP